MKDLHRQQLELLLKTNHNKLTRKHQQIFKDCNGAEIHEIHEILHAQIAADKLLSAPVSLPAIILRCFQVLAS